MTILQNFPLPGTHHRPIITDLFYKKNRAKKPLVIFCHGYKGYKDWGVFGRMNDAFIDRGFALLKFNFSHNGGTLEQPIDFPDLDAFGKNNYMMEMDDLQTVIDWITQNQEHKDEIDTNNITLIGHSRGGGIATLTASKDSRIKQLVTWAAVSTLDRTMFQEGPELEKWKKDGVFYIVNGRTKQQMPHYIQFYENYIANKTYLDVQKASENSTIPHLIIHGDGDMAVPIFHAQNLHTWSSTSELYIIPEANHVFGAKQPWTEDEFPKDFQKVLTATFGFLKTS
ncbi:alpha/beta fold hydrolase [Flavobacteriaceae bacterium S356]|uniref:Alpha/beta fold hydrolase n=1 Tax=Asprobacillus argus TaxID=3076534 RepID=A0ABU3LGI1_9FLAO|nr:alpha/beta fold hydrolase [Flavobacteriaceae bacterium S356]